MADLDEVMAYLRLEMTHVRGEITRLDKRFNALVAKPLSVRDARAKTTINVKGVAKKSWQDAKEGAAERGLSMGNFLSLAIDEFLSRPPTDGGPRDA